MILRDDRLLRVLTDVESRLLKRRERANLSFEIRQLIRELEFLQDQVEVLEEERVNLESQLLIAEPEVETIRAELDRLKKERDDISASGNVDDLAAEIEEKIREMARLDEEIIHLEVDIPAKLKLVAGLEARLEDVLGSQRDLDARMLKVRQDAANREQSLGILSYINLRIGAWIRLKRPDLNAHDAKDKPDTLREFIDYMSNEVETCSGDLAMMTAELQELQSEEKKFIFNRQRLEVELRELSRYLEEGETVDSLKNSLDRLTHERNAIEARLLSTREELAAAESEDEHLALELTQAEAELQEAKERQAALESTQKAYRSEGEPTQVIGRMQIEAESLLMQTRVNLAMRKVVDGILPVISRSNERMETECAKRRDLIDDVSRVLSEHDA